jgi:hypothetical protein
MQQEELGLNPAAAGAGWVLRAISTLASPGRRQIKNDLV